MMIVWMIRGKTVRTVLCYAVYSNGAHCTVVCPGLWTTLTIRCFLYGFWCVL